MNECSIAQEVIEFLVQETAKTQEEFSRLVDEYGLTHSPELRLKTGKLQVRVDTMIDMCTLAVQKYVELRKDE